MSSTVILAAAAFSNWVRVLSGAVVAVRPPVQKGAAQRP